MGKPTGLLQGTLDLLILKTISFEPMNGWAIAKRITQISKDVLQVQHGSLYPALHGWKTRAGSQANSANRKATAGRDTRRTRFVETSWRDLRYGFRMLRSTPLFTAVALITSAIGIGANTTVLSTFGRAPRTRPLLPAGTKLLSGRDFDAHDRHDGHPVAIVNQTAARLLFGGRQSDRSVGLIAIFTAGHLLSAVLYDASPRDPLTYGVVLPC